MIDHTLDRPAPSSDAACGCCDGTRPITPEPTANRPGLQALTYRIGTHATFLETMKARLSSWCVGTDEECRGSDGKYPLEALRTRDASDFGIAMLDAWAIVADVLTFYQERIANEGYLRSATERRSVLELARLVGYRLRPGVAASVFLAYTIDENTKEEVVIPRGARSQSVPGPDELPQAFETSDDLKARAAWNNLRPRQTQPQTWTSITGGSSMRVYLDGISTGLKPNDALLIDRGTGQPAAFRVIAVEMDPLANRTKVELKDWIVAAADFQRLERLRAAIEDLIARAPRGATADRAVERLRALADLISGGPGTPAASSREIARTLRRDTLPLFATLRAEAEQMGATRLAPWLRDSESAMGTQAARLEADDQTRPQPSDARSANGSQASPLVGQLELLTKPRSQPRTSALQLPRDLKASFATTSDAGLKVLGAVRNELRDTLPAVLASYGLATPASTLTVYALKQKAALFGHNFPKRQRIVRSGSNPETTETEVIGEWPIVLSLGSDDDGQEFEVVNATEAPSTLFLDASYDTILPDSWVLLDFSAVPNFQAAKLIHRVRPTPYAPPEAGDPAPPPTLVARATNVQAKVARGEYGSSGDSTRIALDRDWFQFVVEERQAGQDVVDRDFQAIRGTVAYVQSEPLRLAEEPIVSPVCGGADPARPIELNGLYADLTPGRFVIVTGERADIPHTTGVRASEAVMLADVLHDVRSEGEAVPNGPTEDPSLPGDRTHTFIRFDRGLSYCYTRGTVVIHGNVVKATHGETRQEVMGSGDGARRFQSFALRQPPLTYLAAATPAGAVSTLEVFVNQVRWHEAEDFATLDPRAHAFVTKTDDEAKTTVVFGDGQHGARLPTGIENVQARYRNGIGKPGNVRAGQISLLSTRPLGVKEVINPLRASGGADREDRDQARVNAPTAVKALDRLVSVRDYQDFARTFAGIGKAFASELTDGRRSVVHVTIAGADDIPIDEASDLFLNLRSALIEFGDPFQPVVLAVRELLLLVVSAGVRILPDYQWEPVITAVRAALLEAFGFARRDLGEDVRRSEVIQVIQAVRGVAYVDLDILGAIPETVEDPAAPGGRRLRTPEEIAATIAAIEARQPIDRVPAGLPAFTGSGIRPAQIALLVADAPETLVLNQLS